MRWRSGSPAARSDEDGADYGVGPAVAASHVTAAMEKRLGRPVDFMAARFTRDGLDELRDCLARHIVGQDRAAAVCNTLKRATASEASSPGPVASFLFVSIRRIQRGG